MTFQGLILVREWTHLDSQFRWNFIWVYTREEALLFTESSGVRSQRGQKHDGVAMLMTSNHSRTSLVAPGKPRSHVFLFFFSLRCFRARLILTLARIFVFFKQILSKYCLKMSFRFLTMHDKTFYIFRIFKSYIT